MSIVSMKNDLEELLEKVREISLDAIALSKESKSKRRQVGAILVDDKYNKIAYGVNCIHGSFGESLEDENGVTRPEVIHAEQCVLYQVGSKGAGINALFVTTCPCKECAALISTYSRIFTICFTETYRNLDGLELLLEDGLVTCLFFSVHQDTLYKIERIEDGLFVGHKLVGKGTLTIAMGPYNPTNIKAPSQYQTAPWEDPDVYTEASTICLTSEDENDDLKSVNIIND